MRNDKKLYCLQAQQQKEFILEGTTIADKVREDALIYIGYRYIYEKYGRSWDVD